MRKIYQTNNGLQEILDGQDFLIQDDWKLCELKEDGTPYSYYNEDGTPDLAKENLEARKSEINTQLSEKQSYLNNTGWIWEKYNRNVLALKNMTDEEFNIKYTDIITTQEQARLDINTLQAELESL